jgi:predicted Ser/Thr protein kinase
MKAGGDDPMTTTRSCPECGAELPPDAPQGLCPKCLLGMGIEPDDPGRGASTTAHRAPFVAPGPAELARLLPQLEVIELLGQGGMGAVYKVRQPGLDRLAALKVLPPEVGRDPAFAGRFAREARALARLSHPHIVAVYDFGQADGLYYVLMEYVDGVDLRRALQAGELSPAQALAIVPQICDALQFAHDQGVVHRDIKPENILLDRKGRVKVADFGLAKLLVPTAADRTLTAPEQVMGTLHYMAPEQLETPKEVDHRADIYSLGVVFYEMLTGRLPLGHFEPPSRRVRVDVRLDEVVLHALEREPQRRYQHASEVKSDVESISGSATPAPGRWPAAGPGPAVLPPGAGPRLLLVAVALVVSLLMMAAGLVLLVADVMTQRIDSGEFWGWVGGAFGCLIGGAGSLLGTWNSYRQMEGAADLMSRPDWTWLDRVIGGYGLLGLLVVVLALAVAPWPSWEATYSLLLLGGIVTFQGGLFLGTRALLRRAAMQEKAALHGHDAELD